MATTNFDTTTGQIDVLSNIAYIDGPPHEALAWLRANRPLHHQTIDDPIWIGESYVLTRHADVKAVSVDLENFGNGEGHNLRNDHSDDDTRHLLNSDRPKHTDLRSVMSREFTPRVVRQLGDTYANLASDAVQAVADEQSFDFVERVAVEVPMKAIVALMGAPVEDQDRILRWSNATISNIDPDYSPTPEARMEAFGEMTEYAMMLKAARDASASDDVSGLLVQALARGELTPDEYVTYVVLLFVAGNETTRNAMSWGMKAFAEHPDQWTRFRSDPAGLIDTTVEEVIRWASPVNYMSRTVKNPVELHGTTLQPGKKVSLMYLSANRDETVFDDPFNFDITRSPNPHLAFGHGAHFCLGAHLARLQVRSLLLALAPRVQRIELTGEPEHVWSSFINGIKRLPLRLVNA